MNTVTAVVAAVVLSITAVGCGAEQSKSNDRAKPVTQTVQPDPRPPAGSGDGTRRIVPVCRDHIVCAR